MSNTESKITEYDILSIMQEFFTNKNSRVAIIAMLEKIFNHCEIDNAKTIVYDEGEKCYKTTQSIDKKNGVVDYLEKEEKLNIDKYLNLFQAVAVKNVENLENIKKLFNEKNFIHTDNFASIKDDFLNVGFKCENEEKISDIYIYLAHGTSELFTYYVFEKHDDKKFSDIEIEFMTTLCQCIGNRLSGMITVKKIEDRLLTKKIVLSNERTPIAVIDAESFVMLSCNKFYGEISPNANVGEVYEVLKEHEKGKTTKFDGTDEILLIDTEYEKKQLIKKAIPLILLNGKKAYIIYGKSNVDYINQINAKDNLTQSLLLRGFEEYYKSFVQRDNDNYALCTLDIDKFKYINTMFGYEVGDSVLKKVSSVISDFIDSQENFCRMGEDKFSILIHYKDDVHLHLKLRELSSKFEEMKDEHFTDAKITIIGGVTLVDKTQSLNTLLDQATTARKSAKGALRNTFSYYNVEIDIKLQKEIQIEEQIPHAIANDEFVPFLQPKFDLKTKTICGAEALVRWITPKGMIFPDQFIPLFEKNGFITTLDFIVYDKVMAYIRKCIDAKLTVYPISVNVSRNHIKNKDFIEKFMALINKYNVPHEYLELEVTESVFIEDRKKLKEFIDKIKEQNLKVSIDDFGTAYSSLQTLTDVNVDVLKIDKGFLDNVAANQGDENGVSKDEILLKSIISLAEELGFKVICEGVETDEQISLLCRLGCELGQGYVFAKPMSISDYDEQFINE